MDRERELLEKLIIQKEQIIILIKNNNIIEAQKVYNNIKELYFELTGKMFEEGLSSDDRMGIGCLLSDKK